MKHGHLDARRSTRHDDDNIPAPTSWAGDKKEHIRGILQFQATVHALFYLLLNILI